MLTLVGPTKIWRFSLKDDAECVIIGEICSAGGFY